MPRTVVEGKAKKNIKIAIVTSILALLPLIVLIIISFSDSSVFENDYSFYTIGSFIAALYFGWLVTAFSWKNRSFYMIVDIVTFSLLLLVGVLRIVIPEFGYYRNGTISVLTNTLLFYYVVNKGADSNNTNDFIFKYFVPVISIVLGLVLVLWFDIGASFDKDFFLISGHIIFVILAIIAIVQFISFYKKGKLDSVTDDTFVYDEQTEAERLVEEGYLRIKLPEGTQKSEVYWMFTFNSMKDLIDGNNYFYDQCIKVINNVTSWSATNAQTKSDIDYINNFAREKANVVLKNHDYNEKFIVNTIAKKVFDANCFGKIFVFNISKCEVEEETCYEDESQDSIFIKIKGDDWDTWLQIQGKKERDIAYFPFDKIHPQVEMFYK